MREVIVQVLEERLTRERARAVVTGGGRLRVVSGHRRPRFEGRLGQVLVAGAFLTAEQFSEAETVMIKENKRLTAVLRSGAGRAATH
jgi:hypothetical protein